MSSGPVGLVGGFATTLLAAALTAIFWADMPRLLAALVGCVAALVGYAGATVLLGRRR